MSIRVERCLHRPSSAPAHSSVHRIVSVVDQMVAFKVWVTCRTRSYEVRPTRGFLEGGGTVALTVVPIGDRHPEASLRIDWIDADPLERDVRAAFKSGKRSGHIIHPLNSKAVYSDEKYPTAMLKAHADPYAKLRRSWIFVKFGRVTPTIRDSDIIWSAALKIYNALCFHQVMLEEAPLYYSENSANGDEVASEMRRRLDERKKCLFPVLLLIDDCESGQFSPFIRKRFSKNFYVFELSGQELADIAVSTTERPYKELDEWCREFSSLVRETEKGKSTASSTGERYDSLSSTGDPQCSSQKQEDDVISCNDVTSNESHSEVNMGANRASTPVNLGEGHSNVASFGSPNEKRKMASAEDILEALKCAKSNRSDVVLVTQLADPHLFNRLASPFIDILPNICLMQLIFISCSVKIDSKDVYECAIRIIDCVISTRYIPTMCEWFGYTAVNDSRQWDDDFSDFLVAIMDLFIVIDKYKYHGEEVWLAWTTYYDVLTKLPEAFWAEETARDWLENVAVELKHLGHYHPARSAVTEPNRHKERHVKHEKRKDRTASKSDLRNDEMRKSQSERDKEEERVRSNTTTPEVGSEEQENRVACRTAFAKQKVGSMCELNSVLEEKVEPPLWQECENRPPPCDFRTLSEYPAIADIYNAEKTYVRRAIIDGKYTDAEHYLDVQYRLFREDLISPLRDGIAVYVQNGSTRYNRCVEDSGTLTSDVLVFEVEKVLGLESRDYDGVPLRFAKLASRSISDPALSKHLMFGQIVCLSSDGFHKEFHLARIVERDDTENNGIIGLSLLYGDDAIKKNCSYLVAEPNCYLQAYQHVLSALKSFKKYEPLPMGRYIVHRKVDVRKPLYMRFEETVEELIDDSEMLKNYADLRAQDNANIIKALDESNSKAKTKKPMDYDGDSEDDSETPIMKPLGRVVTVEGQSHIAIDGTSYTVDNMLEEFKPSKLDESQRLAVIRALTNELAIIQGPPGTGKTFIGVELARIILQNRTRWGIVEPILVVAYSNNAVDGFAEKLLKEIYSDMAKGYLLHDGPLVVRLGSKSENEFLKRSGYLREDVVSAFPQFNTEKSKEELNQAMKKFRETRQQVAEAGLILYIFKRDLPSYHVLTKNGIIPETFRSEFQAWRATHCDSSGRKLDNEETLACWLLGKVYTRENFAESLPEDDVEEMDEDEEESGASDYEMEGCETLDSLLNVVNQQAVDSEETYDEMYLTEQKWNISLNSSAEKDVVLLKKKHKSFSQGAWNKDSVPVDKILVQECSEVQELIVRVNPMSAEEASDVKSVFSLTNQRRWELFMLWMEQLKDRVRTQLPRLMDEYRAQCERKIALRNKMHAEVLRHCLVIFSTTTGAAKERDLLKRLRCPIVFVEEAAWTPEAHTLASFLPTTEHVVLIGDHQQLRPSTAVYELAREYNLEVSMFERLVMNGHPYSTLQVQHRMNSDITSNIIRPYFYPDVADHASVLKYPDVPGMDKKCFFWMHDEPETTSIDALSKSNAHEVNMVVALVGYLQKQGINLEEITIITTYSAQQSAMQEAIVTNFGRTANDKPSVAVETVDGFQGKENRIVIVSLVRSLLDGIGFLAVKNRITVALTRALHGMYVVGNLAYMSDCSSFWRKLAHDMYNKGFADSLFPIRCQRHGNVQVIEHPVEFATKSPEGGCMMICDAEMPCGHKCPRRCHVTDDHDSWDCTQPCSRRCKDERYRHPCQRLCYEPCGDCAHPVQILLKCGHSTNVLCHMSDKAVCHKRCEKILNCGHQCPSTCGKPCDMVCLEPVTLSNDFCNHSWTVVCSEANVSTDCPKRCPKTLSCGHDCQERCGQPCTVLCNKPTRRHLDCGHTINVPCHVDETSRQCEVKVLRDLELCGHSVMVPCHAGTNPSYCPALCDKQLQCGHKCMRKCGECFDAGECRCEAVCSKSLPCGHQCSKRCGELCEPCTSSCLTTCKHQDCGSTGRHQVVKYGRNCSQICALCPKLCDNNCQHRSCSKKCYEVCSIRPCEQPCTMRLSCGHGCLGMCGEVCPRLCGTCNKRTYISLIEEYLGANATLTKLPRLIEIQGCCHAFPVEVLDKHAKLAQNESTVLLCPRPSCNQPIMRVQRYAKLIKKYNLERYYQRASAAKSITIDEMKSGMSTYRIRLIKEQKTIFKIVSNQRIPNKQLYVDVMNLLTDAHRTIEVERLSKPESFDFWREYARCLLVLSKLLQLFITAMPLRKSTKNLFDLFNEVLPSGGAQKAFMNEARLLSDWLSSYVKTRLVGAVVPRARYLVVRSMFFSDLLIFGKECRLANKDLPNDAVVDSIRSCIRRFIAATPDQNYLELFDNFESVLVSTMKEMGLRGLLNTRSQAGYEIPEF